LGFHQEALKFGSNGFASRGSAELVIGRILPTIHRPVNNRKDQQWTRLIGKPLYSRSPKRVNRKK
jgi:hypothetical protein